ncbi:MAG: TonB-dependent receptor [Alteromonadaceae bacterium]|nr:TonB-dependent receptor [Alteromonadaceae bacterium]
MKVAYGAEAATDWHAGMSDYSYISFTYWNSTNSAKEVKQDIDYQINDKFRLLSGWRIKRSDLTKAYDIPGYWHAYSSTTPSDAAGPYGFGSGIFHSSDANYDYFAKPLANVPNNNRSYFNDTGVYSSVIYDAYPWRLNVGVRYDVNQLWGSSVNPRLSAIYKFNDNESAIKLIYGEAFQEPPAKQLYGGWSGRKANPNLKPEKAKNIELIFMYKTHYWLHDVSLYKAQYKNVIREDALNDANRNIWGIEYRGSYEFANIIAGQADISGHFFYSYTHAKTDKKYDHQLQQWTKQNVILGDISPQKINFLINIPFHEHININIKANYIAKTSLYSRNPLNEQGIKIGSRVIFDTAINYQYQSWQFIIKALNVFNHKVLTAGTGKADSGNDFSQRSLGFANSLIPQPSRSLWLSVSYRF